MFLYDILIHIVWINELVFFRDQQIGYDKAGEENDMTKP